MKPAMWTLEQSLDVVRAIQPNIRPFNYHVALGGGVLNNGESHNDLDLYFMPFEDADTDKLVEFLTTQWGEALPLGGTSVSDRVYPPNPTYVGGRYTFYVGTKRIDAFIA